MAKRYYWLKLPENWFQQKEIKKLRTIAGGDTYTIIYLKMLLISLKNDGILSHDGIEDEFFEELALEIDEEPENVRLTLSYLFSKHLIEAVEDDRYTLPEAKKLTGSEGAGAERMRRFRERHASQSDIGVTPLLRLSDGEKELEKDTEKEIEKDEEKEKKKRREKTSRSHSVSEEQTPPQRVHGEQVTVYYDDPELNRAFTDYLAMRKKVRKPIATDRALMMVKNKLSKLATDSGGFNTSVAIAILDQSIMGSWTGLYALKQNDSSPRNGKIDWSSV